MTAIGGQIIKQSIKLQLKRTTLEIGVVCDIICDIEYKKKGVLKWQHEFVIY